VLDLDPENVVARFDRASLSLEERDREGALADLRTVLDLDPMHQEAARRLDEIESGSGSTSEPGSAAELLPEPESIEIVPPAISARPADLSDTSTDLTAGPDDHSASTGPGDASDSPELLEEGSDRSLFTRTMGDLYASQGFLEQAVEVYRHLSANDPEDAELSIRFAELRVRFGAVTESEEEASPQDPLKGGRILAGSVGEFESSERTRGPGQRSIRSYFADLLAWVPGAVPIASLAPDLAPDVLEVEDAPVPIGALAPGVPEAGTAEFDGVVSSPIPELGVPVPISLLAPDPEGPTPSSPMEDSR
jgi:tetratricopeptide (TPR) repeat protein